MLKLKKLLSEVRLYGRTIQDLLDEFQNFSGRDFIFFDTETLGLNPIPEYIQLTQIGAIVVDADTMRERKTLNLKIKLNPSAKKFLYPKSWERQDWEKYKKGKSDKTPTEILNMTGYFNELPANRVDEEQAIQTFIKLIKDATNPILVAHNASFDMKFISVRAKRYGITIPRADVIDTLQLAKYYLIPVLKKLEKSDILRKLKSFKEMKVSDIAPKKPGHEHKHTPGTEFEEFTAEDGTEMLRIIYGKPSISLGKLTTALIGNIEDWHNALADVHSMILMYQKIIEILYANRNIDISQLQSLEYKKFKNKHKGK